MPDFIDKKFTGLNCVKDMVLWLKQ